MKITLRHIRCALAVTRHGNITQAAEHLNVSQPAVSAALNELEELMGKALFVRQRGQGVTLTPFGRHAMDKAQQIVAGVHELERLADERRTLSGELTLGCFEDLAPYCLPQLLRGLKESHPAIGVSIREYGFDQISKQLSNGTLDAALSYDLGLPDRIRSTVLCELSAHALLPADHPLAEQGEVSLRQLCNYPLVLTNQAYSSQHFWSCSTSTVCSHSVSVRPTPSNCSVVWWPTVLVSPWLTPDPLAITATMDSHWPSVPLPNRCRHSVLFWLSRAPAATRPGQCAAGTGDAVVW